MTVEVNNRKAEVTSVKDYSLESLLYKYTTKSWHTPLKPNKINSVGTRSNCPVGSDLNAVIKGVDVG